MSFSSEIKRITCKTEYECPGCRLAELSGFFRFPAKLGGKTVHFNTSLPEAEKRIEKSLLEELGINAGYDGRWRVVSGADAGRLTEALMGDVILYECCKTAYIRGAFLAGGSVSDPRKDYHLEFDTKSEEEAVYLMSILEEYDFRPKKTKRKNKEIVYIKESSQIADLIGYISGGRAGLEILSVQVEKNMNGEIQRRVNCDSANLNKQARASSRHISAIKKIKAAHKWSAMPEVLREIGDLRLKYPDVNMETLGTLTEQRIGKSGVNHRLNRIMAYAESLGQKEGEVK